MIYDYLWKLLFVMALCAIGMVGSLVINATYGVPYMREVGIAFVVAGLAILLVLVFEVRKIFRGGGTYNNDEEDKPWRSYR